MKAAKNTVVTFHYALSEGGNAIEDSRSRGQPLSALLGYHQLVPGIERALEGREAGEHFETDVAPVDAYGERREGMIQRVPKKYFQHADKLKPGMSTLLRTRDDGQRMVTVHKVGMSAIDVDHNHPLAGKALHFDIELLNVRAATPEELEHGHVHGDGGHAH